MKNRGIHTLFVMTAIGIGVLLAPDNLMAQTNETRPRDMIEKPVLNDTTRTPSRTPRYKPTHLPEEEKNFIKPKTPAPKPKYDPMKKLYDKGIWKLIRYKHGPLWA